MPYPRKQAIAIFMSKKRREGEGAAKAFGRKHRGDFSKSNTKTTPYKSRKQRHA